MKRFRMRSSYNHKKFYLIFAFCLFISSALELRAQSAPSLEVNLLWLLPPFRTYEARVNWGLNQNFEISMGYARQAWTYEGSSLSPGTIRSDALILGLRYLLPRSRAFVDASTWFMADKFSFASGGVKHGPSISHEVFAGWGFQWGAWGLSPGLNVGFYSYRPYVEPRDDRFKLTWVPKISGRYTFL